MKTFYFLLLVLLFIGCENEIVSPEIKSKKLSIIDDNSVSYVIWTENESNIGNLDISNDSDSIYIKILTDKACFLEANLQISNDKSLLSKRLENNSSVHFINKTRETKCGFYYKFSIPIDSIATSNNGFIYLSIDGNLKLYSQEIIIDFPSRVNMNYFGSETQNELSPFTIKLNNQNIDNNCYNGWCIGYKVEFSNEDYDADVIYTFFSSTNNNLSYSYNNLNQINWLINQQFIGKESLEFGIFNLRDKQIAMWYLLDQFSDENWTEEIEENGSWASPKRVSEILLKANENGKDFVPTFGDKLAIILRPDNGYQEVIIEYLIQQNLIDEELYFTAGDKFILDIDTDLQPNSEKNKDNHIYYIEYQLKELVKN